MIDADVSMGGESLKERQFLIESYSVRVDRVLLNITCIPDTPSVDIIISCSAASYDSVPRIVRLLHTHRRIHFGWTGFYAPKFGASQSIITKCGYGCHCKIRRTYSRIHFQGT